MKQDAMETWNGEEDRLLLHLIDLHGTSWKVIVESFPTRTVSSVRNRYQRIVSGTRQGGKNICHKCGMVKRGHICGGGVHTPNDDGALPPSPVTEKPPSPRVSSEFRPERDEDAEFTFPRHLFSWHIVQAAHDMGFEDVTHPPPLVQGFPFVTSLP